MESQLQNPEFRINPENLTHIQLQLQSEHFPLMSCFVYARSEGSKVNAPMCRLHKVFAAQ